MSDGGKGSKQRPTDQNKYGQGYDLAFKKKPVKTHLTVTKDEQGQIVAITRQDAEGQIVEVIAESKGE